MNQSELLSANNSAVNKSADRLADAYWFKDIPSVPLTVGNELAGDLEGGELRIGSYQERVAHAVSLRDTANELTGEARQMMLLDARAMFQNLHDEARSYQDQYDKIFRMLSEQDKQMAQAVQSWTLEEISRRSEERGYSFTQSNVRGLMETAEILNELSTQLEADGEDQRLIDLASTWCDEVTVDIDARATAREAELISSMIRQPTADELDNERLISERFHYQVPTDLLQAA